MKRNFKTLAVTGIVIGCLTIGSIGALAYANGNAYQDSKDAALKTIQEQNMTVTAGIMVKQDGKELISGDTVMQLDVSNQYSNSRIKVNGETVDMESSTIDGTSITRIGDQYTSTSREDEGNDWNDANDFTSSSSTMKLAEMVVDLLVGDVKTHFTSNGNTIAVNLEDAQIPELLNVAVSAAMEQAAKQPGKASSENDLFSSVLENLSITQDVQIKRIGLDAELQDGYLGDNVITLLLTGKDGNGTAHEIEIVCNISFSDIGSTIPDSVDTTGKTVTEVTRGGYYGNR